MNAFLRFTVVIVIEFPLTVPVKVVSTFTTSRDQPAPSRVISQSKGIVTSCRPFRFFSFQHHHDVRHFPKSSGRPVAIAGKVGQLRGIRTKL
jgi:hypothetical protein